MRRITLLLVGMLALFSTTAQRKNFTYKFYGFVRGDLFYNSRANMAPIDGNFYLYPLDKSFDADGKDLNATPNGSFYTFTSRLGLDVTGPDIGKARSSAKIETDFGGFSGSNTYPAGIRKLGLGKIGGISRDHVASLVWRRDAGCLESFHRSAVPAFQP